MIPRVTTAGLSVRRQEQKIREKISGHALMHSELVKVTASYYRICAALDHIGDTTLALSSLPTEEDVSKASAYLVTHGTFQCISILMGACRSISKEVGFKFSSEIIAKAKALEDLRVRVSGHPYDAKADSVTNRKAGSHGICRISLSMEGFALHSWHDDGTGSIQHLSILGSAQSALLVAAQALRQLNRELDRQIQSLESKWSKAPASRHFANLAYTREKLLACVRGASEVPLLDWGVNQLAKCVASAVSDDWFMGIWRSEIEYELEGVATALQHMRDYCSGTENLTAGDLVVYARHACDRIDALHNLAREIDLRYCSSAGWRDENISTAGYVPTTHIVDASYKTPDE